MKRILSGLILFALLMLAIWFPHPLPFTIFAALAMGLGLHEYYSLAEKLGYFCYRSLGFTASGLIVLVFYFAGREQNASQLSLLLPIIAALVALALILSLKRSNKFDVALASTAATVFGVLYVAMLAGFAIAVKMISSDSSHFPSPGAKLLTFFFLVVAGSDTGAYFTGRALGKHKLAPNISPGKTIEGSIGGLILGLAGGALSKLWFFPEIPWLHVVALASILIVAGTLGDLCESMLKRGSKTKDAASIIPGHGGVLDRLDSLLFNAPIIYYYHLLFFKQ